MSRNKREGKYAGYCSGFHYRTRYSGPKDEPMPSVSYFRKFGYLYSQPHRRR